MSIYSDYADLPYETHPHVLDEALRILRYIGKNPSTSRTNCIIKTYGKRSDYGFAILSRLTHDG